MYSFFTVSRQFQCKNRFNMHMSRKFNAKPAYLSQFSPVLAPFSPRSEVPYCLNCWKSSSTSRLSTWSVWIGIKETNSYGLFLMKIELLTIFYSFSIVKTTEITKTVTKGWSARFQTPKFGMEISHGHINQLPKWHQFQ